MRTLRVGLAQINATVGDLNGNSRKILDYMERAEALEADLVSFPEMALTGYPPEDLLLKPGFLKDNLKALKELSAKVTGTIAVVGFVDMQETGLHNAAAVICLGQIQAVYHKMLLPNYGVFDEKRYFRPGTQPLVFNIDGILFGVSICEDIWHQAGPTGLQAQQGAQLIININASPYHAGKIREREAVLARACRQNNVFVTYTNLVAGQDELVFDGQSLVMDRSGRIVKKAPAFEENLLLVDLEMAESGKGAGAWILLPGKTAGYKKTIEEPARDYLEPVEEIYQALVTGLRDYVRKNGFPKVLIGLSGGVDSALVAVLAADALGPENVCGVFMPSRFSSVDSREDVSLLAGNLGIVLLTIPIERPFQSYLETLAETFSGKEPDVTEENIQARIRGNLLMALSNKFGYLVLTTGNKSEMSVGYATLYGDMAGGFAVIKDVYKTMVYELARYRNTRNKVIPDRILTKAPTAELRENQKDTDTLPPYELLDRILKEYIEQDRSLGEIAASGFDQDVVRKVVRMVDASEYKRRQAPPGIKITPKAFGRDRRMPITNKYRGEQPK